MSISVRRRPNRPSQATGATSLLPPNPPERLRRRAQGHRVRGPQQRCQADQVKRPSSHAGDRLQLSGADGLGESLVVPVVLLSVPPGEVGDGSIELVALSEVL